MRGRTLLILGAVALALYLLLRKKKPGMPAPSPSLLEDFFKLPAADLGVYPDAHSPARQDAHTAATDAKPQASVAAPAPVPLAKLPDHNARDAYSQYANQDEVNQLVAGIKDLVSAGKISESTGASLTPGAQYGLPALSSVLQNANVLGIPLNLAQLHVDLNDGGMDYLKT